MKHETKQKLLKFICVFSEVICKPHHCSAKYLTGIQSNSCHAEVKTSGSKVLTASLILHLKWSIHVINFHSLQHLFYTAPQAKVAK